MGKSFHGYFCFNVGTHELKEHGQDHYIGGITLPRKDEGFIGLYLNQISSDDLEAIGKEAHKIIDERIDNFKNYALPLQSAINETLNVIKA